MADMLRKRRSGRIAKELEIVLLGTDTTGKVFSEPTRTVVLSRHGAGIVSRHRFTPDDVLTLRLPDSSKEADVRLVGQIGGEPGHYVYGVAFIDADPHFWPMEFPPPESIESGSAPLVVECSICHERQNLEPHEIEEDVFSVNGNILRYCKGCGTSTPWKKAEANSERTATATIPHSARIDSARLAVASRGTTLATMLEPTRGKSHSPAPIAAGSHYSGASVIEEFSSLADDQTSPEVASAAAVARPPESTAVALSEPAHISAVKPEAEPVRILDANGKRVNRRRHVRIRVSFNACVRRPGHADEVVECENVSKGGLCFHSLEQYTMGSVIQVAAPFSPGETALFVTARIRRVEALSGGQVFRYGLEYTKSSPTSA